MTWEKVLEIKEIENKVVKRILENNVIGNEKELDNEKRQCKIN